VTRHTAHWIAAWLACGLSLPTQLAATDRRIEFDTDEWTWLSLDLSPDGRTILFDLLGDLYTISASGGDARRLTSGPAFDSQPVYSPDGRQIAWLSDELATSWLSCRGASAAYSGLLKNWNWSGWR